MDKSIAIVTGAANGIGAEFSRVLISKGYIVYGVDLDGKSLNILHDKYAESFIPYTCDLTDHNDLKKFQDNIPVEKIDLLVNNAGIGWCGSMIDMPMDRALSMINLNIAALTELSLVLLPQLIKNRGGMINVSSIAGSYPGPQTAVYNATKAFVTSFTLSIYEETKDTELKVTVLLPGHTETDFHNMTTGYPKNYKRGMSPAEVAEFGIESYERGVLVAIPGIYNKFDVMLPRFLPTKLMLIIANSHLRATLNREK